MFADPVEDDDRVVDRVTDDGQDGGHHGRVELTTRQAEPPDRHEHVVQTGDDGANGERKLVAHRHVNQDSKEG